jgi:hypothetical protein
VILLVAIAAGLLAGLARSRLRGQVASPPRLWFLWLALVAFLPQFIAFFVPGTRQLIPDDLAPWVLVGSQLLLLGFVWFNRESPGFRLIGVGLLLNLLVILLNGGLMPISPETAQLVAPAAPPGSWQSGGRFGKGKDIVLPTSSTKLWELSDHLLLPNGSPYRGPLSVGDIFIAAGAFRLLWTIGEGENQVEEAERWP